MIVGIIGTGTIGELLIEAFVESEALLPEQLVITNRHLDKARAIANRHKRIKVFKTSANVVKQADLIILCVKPKEIKPLLDNLTPFLSAEKCLVSVTSPVSILQLASVVSCSVARIIPSITNRALTGVTLFTTEDKCTPGWHHKLQILFSKISTPLAIQNEQTRVAADIVSCGPAFFSFLAQSFIKGAVSTGKITTEEASKLTEEMLIGFAELLKKKHYSLQTLQEKVCVKGGITGEGIRVLEEKTSGLFDALFEATNEKFYEDIAAIEQQFRIPYH